MCFEKGVGVCLERECVEFVFAGWSKVKLYDFIIWSWSKQRETLLAVISKSCLLPFDSYWWRLKLRKLVTKDWVHVSTRLVSAGMVEGSTVEVACTFLADCCWEVQMWKNGLTIKRNIFCQNDILLLTWLSQACY